MNELIQSVEKELAELVAPIEKDNGKSFDTYIYNVNERVNEIGDQVQESEGEEAFANILELMDPNEDIDWDGILIEREQKVMELAKSCPKLSVLFELILDTVKISPLLPMILLNSRDYLNHTKVVVTPIHRFEAIDLLPPSEERATLVFGLYEDVFEQSYKYYLDLIWMLWKLSDGKSIKSKPKRAGRVNNDLKDYAPEKIQSLILPDSAKIRNVEGHQDSTRVYIPPIDSFRWRDHKNPDTIHERTVERLLDNTKEMYNLGGPGMLELLNYFTVYFSVNLYRNDYQSFIKAIKENDQEWLISHSEEIENRMRFLSEPIRGLVA